ncbi:ABC transporter substrate-binding protein [Rhodovulum sulfidophilum]|uniref:ABC transporter substrate-binding protein n=1 Tax=Rhodovulum visakhapatnamense TaxID=364297 RepID=A0ABS1RGC5_9RHOB|nr:ABC transporter substrate-binding protein [Rhodovulum visakhapatnamense]MBL3569190.1 ABC transporter substrate-binding protein [Rhodovulum visakhapatnamense]MBL3578694.1 ABC transporter substrate-binding protein [Rhodovulum visakhapatnamense]OLS44371.1 ABC transporter substrate-binding protein [Rhodovulum sulfidophilum]
MRLTASRLARACLPGLLTGLAQPALAAGPDPADWPAVLAEARGQTVYWNAWGGAAATNDFIRWAAGEVGDRYGVTVEHVKLADTADAVSRVLAEKTAGKDTGGAVDLVWINGANFAAMKEAGLLFGPWAGDLPNWRFVDTVGKPAVTADFTVPTDGFEAPWAMAQVVFYHDTARLGDPPRTMPALLDWARAHPGRFTYPQPPDFLGTTFLKQALYELAPDPSVLQTPADEAGYDAVTAPLWAFLDDLTPHLWRQGRAYPQSGPQQLQLMADGEIDLAISFSPGEASTAIANGQLPDTVRTFVLEGGTIGNASFVAIPYNASAKAGAMVLANFLLSPEAQAHAQDPDILGYGTVLAMDKLAPDDRARFEALDLGIATLSPAELGPALPEPHPSWATRIEADWTARYGTAR